MNIGEFVFSCGMVGIFITCILYVAFGQITVRKLRKDPKTKDVLGIGLISGWDIINVADALSLPKSWSKKLEGGSLSLFYANSKILYQNTTKFDRVLARMFFCMFYATALVLFSLIILDSINMLN